MHPRLQSGSVARPLNFTVRFHVRLRLALSLALLTSAGVGVAAEQRVFVRSAREVFLNDARRWYVAALQSLERAVKGLCLRAAGAWGQCAPAALIRRGRPAPQLHR